MADAKAFTGIALSSSDGGTVLVKINLDADQTDVSEWPEAVDYSDMSDDELAADASADIPASDEDPASVETDSDEDYISETFDEEEE